MYIVYDGNELITSNTNRDFDVYYKIKDDESTLSIEYELINGCIVYTPNNTKAVLYKEGVSKKNTLKTLTVKYNSCIYKADDISVSRLLSNYLVMTESETVAWKTYDGTITTLTKQDITELLRYINNIKTDIITN